MIDREVILDCCEHNAHLKQSGINEAIKKVETRFKALENPMKRRHEELEKSVKMFLFYFDIDNEKLWIAERMPKATSKVKLDGQ